jgi:hypothetical protein
MGAAGSRTRAERNGAGGIRCQPRDCRECSLPEDGTIEWTRSRSVHSAAVGSFRHDVISCAKKIPEESPFRPARDQLTIREICAVTHARSRRYRAIHGRSGISYIFDLR